MRSLVFGKGMTCGFVVCSALDLWCWLRYLPARAYEPWYLARCRLMEALPGALPWCDLCVWGGFGLVAAKNMRECVFGSLAGCSDKAAMENEFQ